MYLSKYSAEIMPIDIFGILKKETRKNMLTEWRLVDWKDIVSKVITPAIVQRCVSKVKANYAKAMRNESHFE